MQIFPKTKGFCNKQGLIWKKNSPFFNKNYVCILTKKSNPEYWVLDEKKIFGEKKNIDPWLEPKRKHF